MEILILQPGSLYFFAQNLTCVLDIFFVKCFYGLNDLLLIQELKHGLGRYQ